MRKYLNRTAGNRMAWPFLLLSVLLLSACDDERCIRGEGDVERRTLQLQPFSDVEANGDFKVYITQGATQQVEVRGQPNILDQVNTQVSNGRWKITHDDCVRRSKEVEVYITMPEVKGLAVNGSGSISGENKFTATELPVYVNGSGSIDLELEASKVITRVTGSGKVHMGGTTEVHSINMSGSGSVAAFNLAAEDVTINISGSGDAEVEASNSLTVDISGSGKVYYVGNPTVSSNISGSGKVVKK